MSRFSIILPVRNGGEYLKTCIASILAQTYTGFNLLVLENNSTDGSLEWLNTIKDPRVQIFPAPQPLSIEENWGRILEVPKNDFITLIGHDDVLQPDYLATMVDLILKHPGASLYQTHFSYIDSEGKKIRDSQPMPENESAVAFVSSYLQRKTDVMGTGFMMRAADYHKLGGIPLYPNLLFADFELWIRLTELNYKATAANNAFSFRLHQSTTSISPDIKFQQAFSRFIGFLESLAAKSAVFRNAITQHGAGYLLYYCQALSHRLLRSPASKRHGLTVARVVADCIEYAKRLDLPGTFDPRSRASIRMALMLDSNPVTRSIFLGFKKIYSKPLLR